MTAVDRHAEEMGWYCGLVSIPGLGRKKLRELYEKHGSFSTVGKEWRHVAAEAGFSARVIGAGVERLTEERTSKQLSFLRANKIGLIGCWEEAFPPLLLDIPDPPLALFYKGDRDLMIGPAIGIVGSRKPTHYGRAACTHLVKQLCGEGLVIVSGLAHGIDAEAHKTALRVNGATIGVLGCGIDIVYPTAHRSLFREVESAGLLISEYPPGVPPVPGLFPERNRIISGLSAGVIVIEAAERSGSLVTADCALDQGREVFAVPGPIFSEVSVGPNNLVKQGAKLVTGIEDVLNELPAHWKPIAQGKKSSSAAGEEGIALLDAEEQRLFAHIRYEPIHMDEVGRHLTEADQAHLYRTLLKLESKNVIASLPGGYYVRR
ncbi:DNA-processing protein DprA [Brevibacillus borstelensis]|uniref:DNA-processing protein DprA n=1 Tax=Brevibacillus borstelensis TaxID=45462 RepID=UPI0030BB4FD2